MEFNTKRIAKNTLFLYFRQILILLVSLYTVRLKLEILGIEDYGIYNIVAGFVVFFAFLKNVMLNATQRFLNFAIGKIDIEQTRDVFSISILFHFAIAVIVIILAETIGLYLLYNVLNIPFERQSAAFIVYQLSIAVTVLDIIKIPYGATISAYERMSFFALLSILEAFFKLAIVILLSYILYDKLIVYSILFFISVLILFFIEKIYCNKSFEIAHFRIPIDKTLYKQIGSFSAWNIFTEIANICQTQGINVLLNVFHGVIFNAAIGIATQVKVAIYNFVSNFQKAFRPQIINSYAAKEYDYFIKLIFQTSKMSYFLLFIITLPLCINIDFILNIWLKNVPEYAIIFTQLMLINSLITSLTGPFLASIQATGDIKKYQIVVSLFTIANLPLSFIFLFLHFNPFWVLVIRIVLDLILLFWQILFLGKKINLPVLDYFKNVILRIILITILPLVLSIYLNFIFSDLQLLIFSTIISIVSIIFLVYFLGLSKNEKKAVLSLISSKLKIPKNINNNIIFG